ncbi:MAG: ribonuclease D [Bacteroidota bacterium]
MSALTSNYTLIEDQSGLEQFFAENQEISWMGFDTEFIGEKRFYTLLCLIQVCTENGTYLLDTMKLKDIQPFLQMIQNPKIVKITHAGENDYRLLHQLYSIIPSNTFDIQLAAGFIGYKYPISFQKIVEKELGVHISKGYTVSDWESRPINRKQLQYALNDVIYLKRLWDKIRKKLQQLNREDWVEDECKKLESQDYYHADPDKEALSNNLIQNLATREQLFLIRLYRWRRQMAAKKDYSKEMVLQNKYIAPIVRHIGSGRGALKNHRRIPDFIIKQHWETFNGLYHQKPSEEEEAVLKRVSRNHQESNLKETIMELLQLLINYHCHEQKLAPDLLLSRSSFKKMKTDLNYFDQKVEQGWRKDFLGEELLKWLKYRDQLEVVMEADRCVIRLKD